MGDAQNSEQVKLTWDDVEAMATGLFAVWLGLYETREMEWAELAWSALEQAGLTMYANEVERHVVLSRLVCLAVIYREFCRLVWDVWEPPEYDDWVEDLELSPFRLGQIVGRGEFDHAYYDDYAAFELHGKALEAIVETERPAVVAALKRYFGNDSILFASLYATCWDPPWCEDDELGGDDDLDQGEAEGDSAADEPQSSYHAAPTHRGAQPGEGEEKTNCTLKQILEDDAALGLILNDVEPGKAAAFEWITQGMESLAWE